MIAYMCVPWSQHAKGEEIEEQCIACGAVAGATLHACAHVPHSALLMHTICLNLIPLMRVADEKRNSHRRIIIAVHIVQWRLQAFRRRRRFRRGQEILGRHCKNKKIVDCTSCGKARQYFVPS